MALDKPLEKTVGIQFGDRLIHRCGKIQGRDDQLKSDLFSTATQLRNICLANDLKEGVIGQIDKALVDCVYLRISCDRRRLGRKIKWLASLLPQTSAVMGERRAFDKFSQICQ